MPGLKSAGATAANIADAAADMLGDVRNPLIVSDYSYHAAQVLMRLRERGCGQRARSARPQALAEAALVASDAETIATVAGVFMSSAPVRLARVTRMQADIYCFLARHASSFASLKSASIMARTLADMEDYLDQEDPFAKIDSSGAYAAELEFLSLLWQDKASAGQRRRRERLLAMAETASQPLAFICFHKPAPLFREFLEKWQSPAALIEVELDDSARQLDELWRQEQPQPGHPHRRQKIPAAESLSTCMTENIEDASRMAFAQICEWLDRGIEKIGIVAYDRPLARRINSACNAAGIHLEDKTGWAADNMLVGSCLLAAAQLAAGDGRNIDNLMQALCIHMKKSGQAWQPEVRRWQHEQSGAFAGMAGELRSQPLPTEPSRWLLQIAQMAGRQPLDQLFAGDHAATMLIDYLHQLANEFEDFDGALSSAEMLGLLRESVARLHIPAAPANCPLHIIPPYRVTDEPFDALLLLGADASTLPGIPEHFAFNETVRRGLGLPSRENIIEEIRRSTAALLAAHAGRECLALGVGSSPSPYLELLVADENKRDPLPPPWQHRDAGSEADCASSVTIPAGLSPQQVSPSEVDILMACPYKFFVEALLRAKTEERASLFDPARFGQLVHAVLKIHHDHAKDGENPESLDKTGIRLLAETGMNEAERQLMSWRLQPLLEEYEKFFSERRAQGWKPIAAEKRCTVELDAELNIALVGYLDLIEANSRNEQEVGDIKTGAISRSEVLKGEKPQLLLYARMAAVEPRHSFLRIARIESGRARIEDLYMDDADPDLSEKMFRRLQRQLQQMFVENQPLPANGTDKSCRSCSAAGMCRRPHWKQPH